MMRQHMHLNHRQLDRLFTLASELPNQDWIVDVMSEYLATPPAPSQQ
jgi:hypothetical protein